MRFKTIQWNIGGAIIRRKDADPTINDSYQEESIGYVSDILEKLGPDIITLQETHANEKQVQAETIAHALGFSYFVNDEYDNSHLRSGERLGQAVISCFPISGHSFKLFLNPHYKTRRPNGEEWVSHDKGITSCMLELSDSVNLLVQTIHLTPFRKFNVDPLGAEAEKVRKDVADKIDEAAPHYLLQGDFNYDGEILKDFLPDIFPRKAEEIPTVHPTTPKGRKYDHILFRGVKVIEFRILDSALTDHYPILTTFEI